jgi:hypothetical protein
MKESLALLLAWLVLLVGGSRVEGNGDIQREIQARVVSVDQRSGTFEIERQFRGKVWRLTLKATRDTQIFTCSEKDATLAELQPEDAVTVYYEAIGREGVVTLIVVEPKGKGR